MTATLLGTGLSLPRANRATRAAPTPATPAAELRDRVLACLAREASWDARTANVWLDGDTVVLQGLVRNAGARHAARRVAAAVPGVQRVRDARVVPREG
jgi:osmotically-inducible protein OsmY